MAGKLTPRLRYFAEMLIGEARFNASEAARAAGFSAGHGCLLAKDPRIVKIVNRALCKIGLSQERILEELCRQAFDETDTPTRYKATKDLAQMMHVGTWLRERGFCNPEGQPPESREPLGNAEPVPSRRTTLTQEVYGAEQMEAASGLGDIAGLPALVDRVLPGGARCTMLENAEGGEA